MEIPLLNNGHQEWKQGKTVNGGMEILALYPQLVFVALSFLHSWFGPCGIGGDPVCPPTLGSALQNGEIVNNNNYKHNHIVNSITQFLDLWLEPNDICLTHSPFV